MKRKFLFGLLILSLLLSGCGKKTDIKESDVKVPTETIEEKSEDTNTDISKKESEVFNLGGSFIGVDDLVYFVALDDGNFDRNALFGEFRNGVMPGKTSSLMCYDKITKECKKVCDTNITDKLSYYNGHLFGTGLDENYYSVVYDTDIDKGDVTKLTEGSIVSVDKNTGDFAVNYLSQEVYVYSKGEKIASVSGDNESDTLSGFYLLGDNLFYVVTKENDDDDYMSLNNVFLHQYNVKDKKDYNLGKLCENLYDDYYDYFLLDQVSVKEDTVYYSVGFYAGTGHFLNNSFAMTAKLNTENSVSFYEGNRNEDNYSDLFFESALPEIEYADNLPGTCSFDYDTHTIMYYYEEDGGIKKAEIYDPKTIKIDAETDTLVETTEYFDDAGYFIINEGVYSPDYSIGWRDAYTLYSTIYMRVVPGEEPEQMLVVNYSEIKSNSFKVTNPCDGYYIGNEKNRDAITEGLYHPFNKVFEEANEVTDYDKFYSDYDLDYASLYNNGDCEISIVNDYDNYTKEGYKLSLMDKNTGQVVCNLDVSEFYNPSGVAESAVAGIDNGWFNDYRNGYVENNILYASFGHRTYADTMPASSFIVAIDLSNGSVLWKTVNQSCNSENFLVLDGVIICGYGFTAEPDYIYFLDKFSGEIIDMISTKTSPKQFFLKDGKFYVRCYDTNYIFEEQR